jgi:hypothetical protein
MQRRQAWHLPPSASLFVGVKRVVKRLPDFEVKGVLWRYLHRFSGFGISSHPNWASEEKRKND